VVPYSGLAFQQKKRVGLRELRSGQPEPSTIRGLPPLGQNGQLHVVEQCIGYAGPSLHVLSALPCVFQHFGTLQGPRDCKSFRGRGVLGRNGLDKARPMSA
jgi:hypothetical protein